MRREWIPEDLIASWTLVEDDWRLVGNKTGSTRLGFALLLKFFELEGRFPPHVGEMPKGAVEYMARQVKVQPGLFAQYAWFGRTIEYHRAQVRKAHGFREPSVEDEIRLGSWLAAEVCPSELGEERQREALIARCREERLEPPGPSRLDRVLAAGRAAAEQRFCALTVERLSAGAIERLEELAASAAGDGASGRGLLAELKADPGPLGLETLLTEIAKLGRVQAVGLPQSCSRAAPRSWSPPRAPGPRRSTRRTSRRCLGQCASRSSRRCAGSGRPRSPMAWSIC